MKIEELERRLTELEGKFLQLYNVFRAEVPLTDYNRVDLIDWPAYTEQQLWFFEREIIRWKNSCSSRPGFAICTFMPGTPLSPLMFISLNMAIKLLRDAQTNMRHTSPADPLIEELYFLKQEIRRLSGKELPNKEIKLLDLPPTEQLE